MRSRAEIYTLTSLNDLAGVRVFDKLILRREIKGNGGMGRQSISLVAKP